MRTIIEFADKKYAADFSKPLDLSIPLRAGSENVNAWYCEPVKIDPVIMGDWIGDVNQGGSVNFRNVFLNPHGNGTHTECVGHISSEPFTLNKCLREFFFIAELVTITPVSRDDDQIITTKLLKDACKSAGQTKALVIRTLPNNKEKLNRQYSNTNPAYLEKEAAEWMVNNGILHLLIDLPSVDRERDEGKLEAHHAFWKYPAETRTDATISELIFVHDEIKDGIYLLNLQITALENDASPSKPVLYQLEIIE